MTSVRDALRKEGYAVIMVPEAATLFRTNGALYPGCEDEVRRGMLLAYEEEMMKMKLYLEDTMLAVTQCEAAIMGPKDADVVMLVDRGVMDVKAYVTPDLWAELLKKFNITEQAILDRYDLVCHMTTAATGAEKFYTLDNNMARSEGVDLARTLDNITLNCWKKHQHLFVVDNSNGKTFNEKLEEVHKVFHKFIHQQQISNQQ